MSINLQITADSPDELFTTLRGLVAGLSTGTAPAAIAATQVIDSPEPKAAPAKATRTRAAKEPEAPAAKVVGAAVELTPEPEVPASEVVIEQPRIETPEGTGELDFDEDVAPHVLNAVQTKGKAWVMELLGEFGVGKASELDSARWPELVERLKD